MKKFLSLLLAMLLCVALVACGDEDIDRDDRDDEETTEYVVSTEAEETSAFTEEQTPAAEKRDVLVKLAQNEIYGLGVNNSRYVPEIVMYDDGTFTFYCNLYHGMITYAGVWDKTAEGETTVYNCTVETWIPADGDPIAVTEADLPVTKFNIRHADGARIAQFDIAGNAYFGMTSDDAYFDLVGGDLFANAKVTTMTNGEVMGVFVSKFNQNNGTLYSFADVTHDGYVEMFAVKQDGYACEFEVYTLEKGTPKLIYEGYSDSTTNGLRYYDLYTEDLYEYIMCAGFYYRQGSPLFYYNIFSLDGEGNVKMFAKNEYNADVEVLENEDAILSEIRHEYNVYSSNCNCPIIDEQNGSVYPCAWEYSRFYNYPETFDGKTSLKKEGELRYGKYSYTVVDGSVKLGRYNYVGITDETEAVVPFEIDGYPVTEISWNTFNGHFRLGSVEIHENITSIEEKAFDNCYLEYIKCPASTVAEQYAIAHGIPVKYIERVNATPAETTEVTEVTEPEPVPEAVIWDDLTFDEETTVGDYRVAFIGNNAMIVRYYGTETDIAVPDTIDGHKVKAIGKGAFEEKKKVTSITLPESVEYIGEKAFSCCYKAETINIPNNVTYIGEMAFYCCESLKSVVIPSGVKVVQSHAFKFCPELETLVLSEGVEVIKEHAFAGMPKLTKIEIPESVKVIETYAFSTNKASEVHIPKNVKQIDLYAFYNCHQIEKFTVDEGNKYFVTDEFGVLYNKDMTKLVAYPEMLTSYTIPDTITEIPEYFFMEMTALERIVIPASVTSIGDYAFRSCSALAEVIVSGNPAVGNYIFSGCDKLTAVRCPAGSYVESHAKANGFTVYNIW